MSELVEQKARQLATTLEINGMSIADLDSQIKELQAKRKAIDSDMTAFKDELREAMDANGITRIEADGILFRLDKPLPVVKITDEGALDEKFIRTKREPDKAKIKQYLKDGPVDGAELVNGKPKLTIKVG